MQLLRSIAEMMHQSSDNRITHIALFLIMWMPLWLVIGRAWADIALCIIGGLFLVYSLRYRKWHWLAEWEVRVLMLLWGYILIQSYALHLDSSHMLQALLFGRFLLFYIALRFWLMNSWPAIKLLVISALPILILVAFDSYWQYITGASLTGRGGLTGGDLDRMTGPLTHPNIGNYFYKIALPVIAASLCLNRDHSKKIYVLLAALCMIFIALIPLSGERSVTLALLVALVTGLLLAFIRMSGYRRFVAYTAIIMVIGALLLATQPVIIHRGLLFVQHVGHFWNTVYGQLFSTSFILFKAYPLFGIGMYQFPEFCQPLYQQNITTYCDVHPHNFYLQWLVETGLIGFSLILVFLLLIAKRAAHIYWYADVSRLAGLCTALGVFIGLIFPMVVTQSNFSNWPAGIYWYSLAFIVSIITLHRKENTYV